jgi:hypothetical protein
MKVTFSASRILHLLLLVALTVAGGRLLRERYDWAPLSAYALACYIVCQVSAVAMKFLSADGNETEKETVREEEKKNEVAPKTTKKKKVRKEE